MTRHYLHVFATFDPGGPQLRTARVLDLLPSSHRHTVVAMDGRVGSAERIGSQVQLTVAPAPRARGLWGTGRAMAGLIRDLRPDLVLTYNWGAIETLLGARLARHRAVVHHEEGFGPEEIDRLLRRRSWMRRLLLRQARAVVVPSRTLETIARRTWRQPEERVRYLPNGVDLQRFKVGAGGAGGVHLGHVSTFRSVKNQAMLLEAVAAMTARDAQLTLVGDGPDRSACEQLARELGIAERVTFAGTSADTSEVYGAWDGFVLSSRTEQMPLVVLEAMASGLPVVSTDVGDVRDMVAEANRSLVVARDDVPAMAAALDRLVGDAELRAEVGAANRQRCEEQFELKTCLSRYAELYEQVAAES